MRDGRACKHALCAACALAALAANPKAMLALVIVMIRAQLKSKLKRPVVLFVSPRRSNQQP
eukprot:6194202-Pleurochrysis_carterae.AAC.1